MNVLVIGRQNAGEKNDIRELSDRLQDRTEHHVEHAFYEDCLFKIATEGAAQVFVDQSGVLTPIENYELVILLHWTGSRIYGDIAHALALYGHHKGIAVWNAEAVAARSTTKLSQLMHLALEEIAVPRSVFCLNHMLLRKHAGMLGGWPVVCKDVLASRGRRNYRCNSAEELAGALAESVGQPMITQAWIENDKSDLRFFVVNSKVGLVIRRVGSEGSHLNNVSAGGAAEILDRESLPVETVQEVERVAKLFGRELCGIDYIFDTQARRYVFLEINGTPQIVNGVFIDQKIDAIVQGINEVQDK